MWLRGLSVREKGDVAMSEMNRRRVATQVDWGMHRGLGSRSDENITVDHLPDLPFEIFSAAVDEAEENIKAPRPLVICSALTVLSLACQGLADVRSPVGQLYPLSLMIKLIAGSGERKSTTLRAFSHDIFLYQKKLQEEYAIRLNQYELEHGLWLEKRKAILSKYRKLVIVGGDGGSMKDMLVEHEVKKPTPPRKMILLQEDVTSQALFRSMSEGLSSVGWISSEASGILKGEAFGNFDKLNSVWSGDGISVDRVSSESYRIPDARLTVSLMIQPVSFEAFSTDKGGEARGSGMWSRFLVCCPESTQGSRFCDGQTQQWDACNRFSKRAVELVSKYIENSANEGFKRSEIRLSKLAAAKWVAVFNEIETEILEGGRYDWAPDHASKLADNMLRLAAAFHMFEGYSGEISCRTMSAAIDLGFWFSRQFRKVFDVNSQLEKDSNDLKRWLFARSDERGERRFEKIYVRRYCPNKLRNKERLDMVLDKLRADRVLKLIDEGRKKIVVLI